MGAPPGDMGGWRGGPAYRGAPAPECLNGGYWKGAPLMRLRICSRSQTGSSNKPHSCPLVAHGSIRPGTKSLKPTISFLMVRRGRCEEGAFVGRV